MLVEWIVQVVMDIGIPILIYITYVCLLGLQFLLVTSDSVFTGFYCL